MGKPQGQLFQIEVTLIVQAVDHADAGYAADQAQKVLVDNFEPSAEVRIEKIERTGY